LKEIKEVEEGRKVLEEKWGLIGCP